MSVRPARLGLLVPTNVDGVPWTTAFDAALAAHTRFWGASGNLIFPLTDDLGHQEVFWALADRFDADAFVTYAPTRTEMGEFAPGVYEAVMSSLRSQAEALDIGPDGLEEFLDDAGDQIAFNEQPTDDQLDLLNARLARSITTAMRTGCITSTPHSGLRGRSPTPSTLFSVRARSATRPHLVALRTNSC
jgi:hypothetical protein